MCDCIRQWHQSYSKSYLISLWPPCVADADIIFLPCGFFPSIFFPRLISAVEDWMSTILPYMVWHQGKFRMHVWNLMHAARWKYRTKKWRIKSRSGHHPTTVLGYIFAIKTRIDNRKKLLDSNIAPTCPNNMVNFGSLAAEIISLVCGTPANFNGFRVLPALLHGTVVVGVG